MTEGLGIVFFGSGAFGLPTLEMLVRDHRVLLVVTQPDRPAGRSMRASPTPVAAWCAAHLPGTAVLKPERVNDPRVAEEVRGVPADAFVVIAFGQKLGGALLEGRFAVNLHASLLPRWRGAAPINHAILAGDTETGNSVITLADRMDAGLILGQSRRAIGALETAGELHDALARDGAPLVERVLRGHASGTLSAVAQREDEVTLAPKLSRADAAVCFAASASECRRRIHAFTPWPGVAVRLGEERVKLLLASEAEGGGAAPSGTLVDPGEGVVSCGGGTALRLLRVQPAGGREMAWPDFARGRRLAAGMRVEGGGGA